ncbi:hypothetical protein THRCLA_10211 [Thraustotheca clavata]|uniref:Uncharacterized protein n=1 Tax=Thraustotheca clavata TaxID=74557 RepID=A0A1V9YS95_9STRA|nr:hypothetical protein THRCLA_10211 [Thraustotheca clavata]
MEDDNLLQYASGNGNSPSIEAKAALELEQILSEEQVEMSLTKDQIIEILEQRLVRRSALIDTIRHAYYHDVIVIKENLAAKQANPNYNCDERIHALPSVDLRNTLPLFAPDQTYLRVLPCEKCGGTLELVHGETSELNLARSQCAQALKAEQNMKGIIDIISELKEATEISDALQQRLKALAKENAFTLEQLQISRKAERDQKSLLAELKSKLNQATANNESVSKLTAQLKELRAGYEEATKQKKLITRNRDDIQDDLQALETAHATQKSELIRITTDCEMTKQRLEDMTEMKSTINNELGDLAAKYKEQVRLNEIIQESLSKWKQEYAILSTKFEQTNRQLEDQLVSEEMARENTHERYMDEKKRCKQLQLEMEMARKDAVEYQILYTQLTTKLENIDKEHENNIKVEAQTWQEKLQSLKQEVDRAQMQECDIISEVMKRFHDDDDYFDDYDGGYSEPEEEEDQIIQTPSSAPNILILPTRPSTPSVGDGNESTRLHTPATPSHSDDMSNTPGDDTKRKKIAISRKGPQNAELVQLMSEMKDMQEKCKVLRHKIHESDKHIMQLSVQITDLTATNQALEAVIKERAADDVERNQSECELIKSLKSSRENIDMLTAQLDRYERKTISFEGFFSQISSELYTYYQNAQLISPVEPPPVIVPEDDENKPNTLSAEILAKKARMKRELYEEKKLNNYVYAYTERVELCLLDIKRAYDFMIEVKHESMEYMRTCQAQAAQIDKLGDTVDRLQMNLEIEKTSVTKLERLNRITLNDYTHIQERIRHYERESGDIEIERNKLLEEKRKIAFIMMEKSKTLDREIDLNEQMTKKLHEMEKNHVKFREDNSILNQKVDAFEAAIQFKKDTNKDVGILVRPQLDDTGMQTDKWKPQGLVLRQRNSPNQIPQRYEGASRIMVACPSLDTLLKDKPLYQEPEERYLPLNDPLERRIQTADPAIPSRKQQRKQLSGRISLPKVNGLPSQSQVPIVGNFMN